MTHSATPMSSERPTIVLIHRAWVGPSCGSLFRPRLEAHGFATVAPAWPHDDRPVEELRRTPEPALAGVGVGEIVDRYASIVRALPAPPILIGHSFGGLFVQMLLDRGLGAAGVAIDSAPPKGVTPSWSAVRASAPVLSAFGGWRRTLRMSYESFRWGFVHTLSEAQARAAYDEHVIPTPGRPFWQAALSPFAGAMRVDTRKADRAPLLLIAGSADRTVTAAMNRANHRLYRRSAAVTDLHELPGRSHWIIAEPGWEEVVDDALAWLAPHAAPRSTAPSTAAP